MLVRSILFVWTALVILTPSLSQGQIITTIAGTGGTGFSGDGGPATSATIAFPVGIVVDAAGNVYVGDLLNQRIRKIDTAGTITTIAGCGLTDFNCIVNGLNEGGQASGTIVHPFEVAIDGTGNLYITDSGNDRIRRVAPDGTITTVAGCEVGGIPGPTCTGGLGDNGPASGATFNASKQVAVDAAGNVYIADAGNSRIRLVSPSGTITTFAGNGTNGFSGDGGPATAAALGRPQGVAVDAAGNVYIADTGNSRIRKVGPGGTITTFAGSGAAVGSPGDGGPLTSAIIITPKGLALDSAGSLYIAETLGYRIRKITAAGAISTVAGNGTNSFSGDGGPATNAALFAPESVAVDGAGNIYIADSLNNRVRKVTVLPANPPQISVAGATNGASFVSGSLVRGSIATIFGANLTSAQGIRLATSLPLPRQVANVQVLVNGAAAPLFAVANVGGQQQINFQVPWILGGNSVTLQVVNNGAGSAVINVPLLAAQPGIFAYSSGGSTFGAILHADYQLADTANPARAGETVLIYCTALGPIIPIPGDGVAASASQTFLPPVVTIGGVTATVSYSGLAPGFVGLNQINVVVPPGLSAGNHPVVITINNVSSNTALLPVQ